MQVFVVLKQSFSGSTSVEYEPNAEVVRVYSNEVDAYEYVDDQYGDKVPDDLDWAYTVEPHEVQ
jgi:hypothetical protein